ncbi:MAG TPA: enoyl-CoA hydratase-related protein [Candidatus Deferrimicrobium sp.]|nr:enoyl-CoA hydratase-related protein [Candidatus Deferrimicrobium sp.]
MNAMRQSTLQTLGLGTVLNIFQRGRLPVTTSVLVDEVFGSESGRGSLVISGANGIVGAGKMMQLGSRLIPYGVTMVGLDFASAPDGIGRQYPNLKASFGASRADAIMAGIVRMNYDGKTLPTRLKDLKPRFLLEAIPEILEVKRAHYEIVRNTFPDITIRSVTSGFPSAELGVGIAHPAFPHEINKVWEIVEPEPSPVTQLLWSLGLMPIPVSDHWSFVLDVLFCGLTLAALRYHRASNMPYWKTDKYVRRLLGPNPFRAHDAIGAKGANYLTWSCLHHLSQQYGPLFTPPDDLVYRKESGQNWYPPNHFRPLVNWSMSPEAEDEFHNWIFGPVIQMTSLMLHEQRSHLSHISAIGELCAQFRRGVLAVIREMGPDAAIRRVEAYHRLHPEASKSCWYPDAFGRMTDMSWQQLYVNAEHDGNVGIITIGREAYNSDVDMEFNRAIDWLKTGGIERVIVTGDFHLSTQMVGADTAEFFPALDDVDRGVEISTAWSRTARRLHDEFAVSAAFVNGKRCLGGMLELLMHCHYLVAQDDAVLGMPEVTLPVVPGMEGCHWPLRRAGHEHRSQIVRLLLTGQPVKATEAVGWLVDYAGSMENCLKTVWALVNDAAPHPPARQVATGPINVTFEIDLPNADNQAVEAARSAIADCIRQSCAVPLSEALTVQAKMAGHFMADKYCRQGRIGSEAVRTMVV